MEQKELRPHNRFDHVHTCEALPADHFVPDQSFSPVKLEGILAIAIYKKRISKKFKNCFVLATGPF